MSASLIVERQIAADRGAGLADRAIGPQVDLLVFTERHRRSTNTLSRQPPRPSMLIAICRTAVNAMLVNWADSTGRRNTLAKEIAMGIQKRRSDRCGRPLLRSPGRPPVATRSERQLFWTFIATGMSSEAAAIRAGVSQPVGTRWFREAGGMPPAIFRPAAKPLSGRYLSLVEREEIARSPTQCDDAQRRLGLPRDRRSVACRTVCPTSQGHEACRKRCLSLLCGGEASGCREYQLWHPGSEASGAVERAQAWPTTGSTMGMGLEPGTDRQTPGRRFPG